MSDNKKIEHMEKELFSERERTEIWFAENWKKCMVFAAIIVIAVVAVFAFFHTRGENRKAAAMALAAASVEELPAVLAANPDAPGTAFARMRLAYALMDKKDFAKAGEEFSKVAADKNAPAEFIARAALGKAFCKENAGNKKEAAAEFSALINDASVSSAVRDEALFHAGRLFIDLKEYDKAKAVLKLASASGANEASMYKVLALSLSKALESGDIK